MIRNDIYTKYEGREYELIKDTSSGKKVIYKLRSLNEKDIERGFVLYERPKFVLLENGDKFDLPPRDKRGKNIYLKNIDKNDVEYVYSIHTFGIYKGHKFRIGRQQQAGQLVLITSDNDLVIPLNMETRDRGYYVKMVDESEVTLFEEKELMPNFFGEND